MKKILFLALAFLGAAAHAAPLRVCATTPDLGALVREIGGDLVEVTVFAKPGDDPHFLDARPSFIRALNQADVYVETGLELEIGWAPLLLQGARNPRVMPGRPGHIDASRAITPLGVPEGQIDRSHGDVHPGGNPHYLLDPIRGLAVAGLLRDRLITLRPEEADRIRARHDDFETRLNTALEAWIARLAPHRGTPIVIDHNLWIYFADRFNLRIAAELEPKPGVPPTTRHLQQVIEQMKADSIRVIGASPYFDERHARFVAGHTGARIARLAHQPGSRPDTGDYIAMIHHNVEALATALERTP
ncbi:MAG TPA: metal ABC transporter substrate-binding protein [Kiritimatiellia bacterium]|nr:metal ABC transporter substrate-binding protein [Kiritimatiellia bacterium]